MEVKSRQVLEVLDDLLASLGLQLEEVDIIYLTQAELYVEMFKVMFPELGPDLDIDFDSDEVDDEQIIQSLIEFLSTNIRKMDLDHISGEFITRGDLKHILNFIQLLNEISKMLIAREDEEGEAPQNESGVKRLEADKGIQSSPTSFNRPTERSFDGDWKENKNNTAQGIASEFSDQQASVREEEDTHGQNEDYFVEEAAVIPAQKQQRGQGLNRYAERKGQQEKDSKATSSSKSKISEASKSTEQEMKKISRIDNQFENYEDMEPERLAYVGEYDEDEEEYEEEEVVEEVEEEEEEDPDEDRNHSVPTRDIKKGPVNGNQGRMNEQHIRHHGHEGEDYGEEQEEEEEYQDEDEDEDDQAQEGIEELEYYDQDHDPVDYQLMKNSRAAVQPQRGGSRDSNQQEYDEQNEYEEEQQEEEEEVEQEEEFEEVEQEEEPEEEDEGMYEREEEQEEYTDPQYVEEGDDYIKESEGLQDQGEEEIEDGHQDYDRIRGEQFGYEQHEGPVDEREIEEEDEEYIPMKGKMQQQQQPELKKKKKKKTKVAKKKAPPKPVIRPQIPKVELRPLRTPTGYLAMNSRMHDPNLVKKKVAKKKPKKLVSPPTATNTITTVKTIKKSKPKQIKQRDINIEGEPVQYEEIQPKQGGAPESGAEETNQDDLRKYAVQQARRQAAREKRQRTRERENLTKSLMRIKGDSLRKVYEGQQEAIYHTMRDQKLNYVKKMNKAIYKLEEKKRTDDKDMFLDLKRTQDYEMWSMMTFMRSNYTEKMETMKKDYAYGKKETKTTGMAQKMFIKTLKRELTLDQFKDIEKLQDRWEREAMRLNFLKQDEAFLDKRLAMIFQK